MSTLARAVLCITFPLLLVSASPAQTEPAAAQSSSTVTVTATAGSKHVRYVSIGEVNQVRLQVFAPGGSQVFDSDFKLGNLIDWALQDQQGARVADGSYLFVITAKDFSGRLIQKYGTTQVDREQVYLDRTGRSELPPAQAAALESNRQGELLSQVDRIGAVGVSSGASSTEISARKTGDKNDLSKNDLSKSDTNITPATSGTGSPNQIAKWVLADTLGDSVITETGGGNVGINTAAPDGKLSVVTAPNTYALRTSGGSLETYLQHGAGAGTWFTNSSGGFTINNQAGPLAFSANNTETMRITNNFLVGIGTAAPGGKLHIGTLPNTYALRTSGGNLETYLQHGASSGTWFTNSTGGFTINNQAGPLAFSANNIEYMRINNAGQVGIGTAGPNGKLHIGTLANTYALRTSGGNLETYLQHGAGAGTWFTNSTGGFTINNQAGPLALSANNTEVIRINNSGNVGVGTPNPLFKLDVTGNFNVTGNATVSGNIAAKYQDVAEWVPSRQQMSPGTVVILDATRTNVVTHSFRPYDTLIAGVVSAQPGVILGERGPGKVMVATTGRVMVKVDASKHPIKIGDLLVTSGKPGVAMKSMPIRVNGKLIHRPGTIIGKALEPLANGAREILVLLSLQ